MRTALVNGRVLTATGFADDLAVVIEGRKIVEVVAREHARAAQTHDLRGRILAPGFIDCQVNGGGGVLFNDAPTVETVRRIAQAHRRFGTTGLLPTLISDDAAIMCKAIDAVAAAVEQGVAGVLGIHLEGPFLARQKKGIHDSAKFRLPDAADIALIASGKSGSVLMTVAPEEVSPDVVRELSNRGVVVAGGHTAATYEQTRISLAAGLRGFTHLFNAMSPLQSRDPGVVGAALEDRDSWCGIIVDGHHVHPAALRVALHAKPRGKIFLVTDAMPPVGADEATFQLNGETITCRDGICTNSAGTLAGSALDMCSAVRNSVQMLGVDLPEALRMASQYPAEFLGLGRSHGRIEAGFAADFVLLDDDEFVAGTWCSGDFTSSR
ncbi:MAG TPA: N-acetylglucosamine-6-phosphate deacetylase [Rudaea sp.]|jgi:N-acetylglucosamine-6-phosphate deacetylase|nr:N-acetylglucosamine-6-phosphate deacetylase [Rudaea sp.]